MRLAEKTNSRQEGDGKSKSRADDLATAWVLVGAALDADEWEWETVHV